MPDFQPIPRHGNLKDLAGRRFGAWIALHYHGSDKGRGAVWLCRCDCGEQRPVLSRSLIHGFSVSCGCQKKIDARMRFWRHGGASYKRHTREYASWHSMQQRCYAPNTIGYQDYGGRGITVCERWRRSFIDFLADMGSAPTKTHSLDKIRQ